MMNPSLSAETVRSFQEIYADEFGESLSEDEARLMCWQLLRFFAILDQPTGTSAKSSTHFANQGGRVNSEQKYS